jgi:hypothetical protein
VRLLRWTGLGHPDEEHGRARERDPYGPSVKTHVQPRSR